MKKSADLRAEAAKAENAFEQAVQAVLKAEGGYVDHPSDPGRATNLGITLNTLQAWRKAPVSKDDVKQLSVKEAKAIYKANYWMKAYCDEWPPALAYLTFDAAVNSGVSRGIKTLQEAVGAKADGGVGPNTRKAVASANVREAVEAFCEIRMRFYRSLKTWDTFGKGWSRRIEHAKAQATSLILP